MQLVPIAKSLEENASLSDLPHLLQSVEYFNRIGYDPPWIGYYVMEDGKFVGSGAFKGKPVNETVEIAYGTFDSFMNKGSCRELQKNGFNLRGTVIDPEDGEVFEWEYPEQITP